MEVLGKKEDLPKKTIKNLFWMGLWARLGLLLVNLAMKTTYYKKIMTLHMGLSHIRITIISGKWIIIFLYCSLGPLNHQILALLKMCGVYSNSESKSANAQTLTNCAGLLKRNGITSHTKKSTPTYPACAIALLQLLIARGSKRHTDRSLMRHQFCPQLRSTIGHFLELCFIIK